ncbi:unnamed protein product [Sympodiomycopsis kandeliae]
MLSSLLTYPLTTTLQPTMSSFFQKARERAQEAASSFSHPQEHHEGGEGGGGHHLSSSTYTGSLPHAFREGLANLDPRFESIRSLHTMRAALKGVIIDEAALSRETKTASSKIFKWGLDHRSDERMDGVGDPMITDVSEKLSYLYNMISELQSHHTSLLTDARNDLKQVQLKELELGNKRNQRIKLAKELHENISHTVVVSENDSAKESHTSKLAYLQQLEHDAKEEEEAISRLKHNQLRSSFEKQFKAYIEYGEKLALISSFGVLLTQQIPNDSHAEFPAHKGDHSNTGNSWQGAAHTAQIKEMVQSALNNYHTSTVLPTLPGQPQQQQHQSTGPQSTGADAPGAPISNAYPVDSSVVPPPAPPSDLPPTPNPATAPLSPLPDGSSHNPNLNHSPSTLPSVASHRKSSIHTTRPVLSEHNSSTSNEGVFTEEDASISMPPGPTVAETGSVLPTSPTGPGPKSGVLQPRRKSTLPEEKPTLPPRPTDAAAPQSEIGAGVNARIRRDGTITRRGIDDDWSKAEAEQLPPYHE